MELRVEVGATILFSDDKNDYPIGSFKPLPTRYRPLIAALKVHDLKISGKGKIDGNGQKWWDEFRALGPAVTKAEGFADTRPKLLAIHESQRIRIEGVTVCNSPMFHISPTGCENVVIDSVTVTAPAKSPNTDSCNPSGWNYIIRNCTFDVGDDNIAVKPFNKPGDGRLSVENIYVLNCTFKHGHGLSVGGQTPGGFRNMYVRDCTFEDTDAGIRLKADRGQGGLVENLNYQNITMKNVKSPILITSYYPNTHLPKPGTKDAPQPVNDRTPIWKDIRISNVTATNCGDAGLIMGLPEMPVQNLTLENVTISAEKPMRIGNVKGAMFKDVKIDVKKGEPMLIEDGVEGEGLAQK
jgi:polygalacturonase